MNICWFSHYFSPEIGAPSARINDLSRCWIADGHQVQVNTCFPNHPTGHLYPGYSTGRYMSETRDNIHVHRHWTYITPNRGFIKKTIGHFSFLPSTAIMNQKYIRWQKPDVVIGTSPTPFAAWSAAVAAKRMNVPFIMEIRDLWPDIFVELGVLKNRFLIKMLDRFISYLYRRAESIVTVTESFRRSIIARGFSPEKVFNIPNGADTLFWDIRKSANGIKLREELMLKDKFVVLYIGAHGISHALSKILDSARPMLIEKQDIHFYFVGEGAEKTMLLQKAQEEGLSNVTFLDPTDKEGVRNYYALADVCLVPLRDIPLFETFIPSKMFEIMAMQRPIVASVAGESAEILKSSKGAIVVPPEDSWRIRDALLLLYENPDKRNRMGENGRAFITNQYSRQALSRQYLKFIQQICMDYRS